MYAVYVLRSAKDGNLYIGCTANLRKRLDAHRRGGVMSTKRRLPVELIYHENFGDKYEAFRAERFYKTPKGKKIVKAKINCRVI